MSIRKLVLFIALACAPSFAAFNSTMHLDVRPTGSDSNGGGFDPGVGSPGTDFSQQDSPQVSYTDIVIGGITSQVTSSAHAFTSVHSGNVLNITAGSGCTVGRFEITSVGSGTAVVDRSMGTAASTCTGVLGGGLLTLTQANTLLVSGNTVDFKAGTYTLSSPIALAVASSTWKGYGTTHADEGTRPLITTATNSTELFQSTTNAGIQTFQNINWSNTASTRSNGIAQTTTHDSSGWWVVVDCTFDGFSNALNADNTGAHWELGFLALANVEIKNSTARGVASDGATYVRCYGCFIHNNTSDGIKTGNAIFWRSTLDSNGGKGYAVASSPTVFEAYNSVFSNNTSDGANTSLVASSAAILQNTIFWGNGGWGLNGGGGQTVSPAGGYLSHTNAWGSNTSGDINGGTAPNKLNKSPTDITLTANPFVSSSNFALNNTAGGGALLRAAGFPGVLGSAPAGTGYASVGVFELQSAGSTFACGFSRNQIPQVH